MKVPATSVALASEPEIFILESESMVDHWQDVEARRIAIGKMVDHVRKAHEIIVEDNSAKL